MISQRFVSGLIMLGVLLAPLTGRSENPISPPAGGAGELRVGEIQAPVIRKPEELDQILGVDTVMAMWTGVPEAWSYHYVLARDRSFKEVLIEGLVGETTSVILQPVDYGTYFLKVRAIASGGRKGPFSEKVSFIVVPDPRPVDSPR